MANRIHYHTHAAFFSGAENMLVNFLSLPVMREQFDISFSYRYSKKYTDGLRQRVQLEIPVYPLHFPEPSDLVPVPEWCFGLLKRGIHFSSRFISTIPILAYEIWVLHKLFCQLRPNILHINNAGYPAALSSRVAAIAAKLAGVSSVIMVVNNLAVGYQRPSRWLNYPVDRLVVNSVSRFVTGSTVAARQLKKVLRLDDAKCLVIHNGITLRKTIETQQEIRKRFGLNKFDGVIFGVVAILRTNKGHQVLLDAIVRLLKISKESVSNIKIIIEGDGPLRNSLHDFVVNNKLSDYCIFVGCEKNVKDFIAMLDVLILPSIDNEDFPNVILEAMGLGKPVIASRLAGTPEQVVDDVTGLLVSPAKPDQLASAIVLLSHDQELRSRMGQAGLRRFQECFTAEVAVKNYKTLYQSLIES